MDWSKISTELERRLDPAHIKPAPKGKFGDYVDAHHVISEANRIFGHGGWSYRIVRLEETHRGTFTLRGSNGEYDQFRCSFMCTVQVQVGDTVREGAAVGMGAGKPENVGDVIESAVKEAETDALKRALRTFGNTFGLALYDKSREGVGVDASDAEVETAISAINASADLDALRRNWSLLYANARHVADDARVIEAKEQRKGELATKELKQGAG